MTELLPNSWFDILERANLITMGSNPVLLMEQMLNLFHEHFHASGASLYLHDSISGKFTLHHTTLPLELTETCTQYAFVTPILEETLSNGMIISRPAKNAAKLPAGLSAIQSIPLLMPNPNGDAMHAGAILVFNPKHSDTHLAQHLASRLAIELNRIQIVEESEQYSNRMEALVTIIEQITSTLDHDQILERIIEYASRLLNTEASSLFMRQENGALQLFLSTNMADLKGVNVVVPAGKGIIGHVVTTGETIIVNDVSQDKRHYKLVDKKSGMTTRNILAVPLKTRSINLGQERGAIQERIIGGLEAMNKRTGLPFSEEDARLLQTLANQAATVLEIAQLYSDTNELFLNAVSALAAVIDAKDPYTVGHSQRVSEFAVEIARQLNLSPEDIHHIRLGSLFHDIGKIGMPDSILTKPGRLNQDEDERMHKHPLDGERILGHIQKLKEELHIVTEHHERLDGSGYPRGLRGDEISIAGRVAAVADVFDAITSDRPYRVAMTNAEAFFVLRSQAGTKLDTDCVEALIRAHDHGSIRTQKERE
jgi:putative nucleotidyltransferase with HDIG domain